MTQPSEFKPLEYHELTEDEIHRLVKHSAPRPAFGFLGSSLRRASVLVPLFFDAGQWHLLYTRRAETLQSHKGQVSFPGGSTDPEDTSIEATALREAYEEVGIQPRDVRIYGRLSDMVTFSNFLITPVVGRIRWPYAFRLSPDEVSRVFAIPLRWLADPANREIRPLKRINFYEDVIYYKPYDGEILWGITAWITVEFLRLLKLTP